MNTATRIVCVASVLAGGSMVMAQSINESGAAGTFDTANWVTDRYTPAGWTSGATDPVGGNALQVDISNADRMNLRSLGPNSTFYNYQGRTRQVSLGQGWQVSGEVYIPSSWGEAGNLRGASLWTRDQTPAALESTSSTYPIVAFINNDASDPFNPNAANFTPRFRVWSSINGWTELSSAQAPVQYDQYNSFKIVDTGSTYDYFINNALVFSLTGSEYSAPGSEGLSAIFLQSYNFGNADNALTLADSGYSTYWRNVSAIPTPGAAAALGLVGLVGLRRRR